MSDPTIADDARVEAATAARHADVEIVQVATVDELDVLRTVMESIWGPQIVPPRNLLRGLALGGNCLLVARRADEPIGFALGWLGWHAGLHFHSHQVGVRAGTRGSGIGFALKLAQRSLCLDNGITEMRWTYDPMLMANARFNLNRLGARVLDFLPHCYGDRTDAFNTGERTDRFEVSWQLDRPIGALDIDSIRGDVLAVPADFAERRLVDPEWASAERTRVSDRLRDVSSGSRRILGVCAEGYVMSTEVKGSGPA
jgi:predicted GNAT superfamily acetyltransferase